MQIAEALKRLETRETSRTAEEALSPDPPRDADSGCTIWQGQRDKSKPAIPGIGRSLALPRGAAPRRSGAIRPFVPGAKPFGRARLRPMPGIAHCLL